MTVAFRAMLGAAGRDTGGGGGSTPTIVASEFTPAETSGSSVEINVPAGTEDGDFMVAVVVARSVTISTPTGWTVLEEDTNGNRDTRVYVRTANSEPASYTWSFSGTAPGAAGGIITVRGQDPGTQVNDSTMRSLGLTVTPVTTTVDNCLLLLLYTDIRKDTVVSDPTGTTRIGFTYGAGSSTNSALLLAVYDELPTAGESESYPAGGWSLSDPATYAVAIAPG